MKKSLIAIAVVVALATLAHAAGPEPHYVGSEDPMIKVDNENLDIGWPFEYKALTICTMPVYMNVGYYVRMEDCTKKKIVLQQVDCGDIGKKAADWPCYLDCEEFELRANFEVKLGTKLTKMGSVMDKWEAYYDEGKDVYDRTDGGKETFKVCVKAWKAQLYENAPGSKVQVGELQITVKPNV